MRIRLLVKGVAEKQGFNRAQLARRADVTYETVWQIYRNEYTDASISTLVKLARALNVEVHDLYEVVLDE
jgi:DNA-binding XRE family transcriptional regulator